MPGGLLPTMPTLPTPTQMTNEKQQRPAHSERASGDWINLLFSIVQSLGHTLPLKLRKPLIVHSMHTGTKSFRMFFRMAGIQVHDSVGAELKPHARTFVSRNRLEPDQFYEDIAEMLGHCKKPLVRWGIAGRIFLHPAFLASRSAECRDGAKRHRTTRCTKSSQWYAITSRRRNRRHTSWRTSLLLYWQKAGQIRETILSRKQTTACTPLALA